MPEGRIMKALSGFYYVKSGEKIYQCRGRGVFRKRNITPLVGDLVTFQIEGEDEGYILEIKDRKNALIRPPIANIDQAFVTFSATDPDLNVTLLDRFLVMIEAKRITPIIVVTKVDLLTDAEIASLQEILTYYRKIGYQVVTTCKDDRDSLQELIDLIKNKISVFAGQSGVGKSTLLNRLRPDLNLETREISRHLGRGRHTTRHVELLEIGEGLVADTPGFSSLEFTDIEPEDLTRFFPEMLARYRDCKFRGCLHVNEPDCAVKDAVNTGDIPSCRYENYRTFLSEIQDRKLRLY
ncbi:MAG: ribosome small subunit-dependent GTPase A [Caldibacillus sp.]